MKPMERLVALLLLLTVFFIRMISEILSFGYNSVAKFAPILTLFAAIILLWVAVMVWPEAYDGGLFIFAATLSLFFVAVLYLVQYTLDLVAALCALIIFALSLGRRGDTHSRVEIPSTMSGMIVASTQSQEEPHSVVTQSYNSSPDVLQDSKGKYVASKRGSFYHNAGSEWAEKIKEENQIWFDSKEEAWEAGYKAHKDVIDSEE